jgi:soluble cytochrome b562
MELMLVRNISSSSRIHRTHEKALQPETIHRLRLAQKAIEDGNVCEKQSDSSLEFPRNATQVRNFTKSPVSPSNTQSHGHISTSPVSQTNVDMMQSFVVISSEQQRTSEVLRSSCSAESLAESFKSALSVQTSELDLARKIKSVQGTIHAFKTAIETLDNLIQRRLLDKSEEIYVAAVKLRVMLGEASQKVDCKNTENYKHHGDGYIRGFHDVCMLNLLGRC